MVAKKIVIISWYLFLNIYDALAYGFILYKLYPLLIQVVFKNLPELSFWQSFGLIVFVKVFQFSIFSELVYNKVSEDKDEDDEFSSKILISFIRIITPWLAYLIAYICYSFIVVNK